MLELCFEKEQVRELLLLDVVVRVPESLQSVLAQLKCEVRRVHCYFDPRVPVVCEGLEKSDLVFVEVLVVLENAFSADLVEDFVLHLHIPLEELVRLEVVRDLELAHLREHQPQLLRNRDLHNAEQQVSDESGRDSVLSHLLQQSFQQLLAPERRQHRLRENIRLR